MTTARFSNHEIYKGLKHKWKEKPVLPSFLVTMEFTGGSNIRAYVRRTVKFS